MPQIDPFVLVPDGPFQRMINYWYATLCRTIYFDNLEGTRDEVLALADPAAETEVFDEVVIWWVDNKSKAEVYHLAGGDILHIRGTNGTGQLASEIFFSGLGEREPWTGKVCNYFGARALDCWERVEDSIGTPWISMGHSMGGALAGLLSYYNAVRCWTIGQPREGDIDYANSRPAAKKLRLFHREDLVPKVPVDLQLDVDLAIGEFVVIPPGAGSGLSTNYRHWGIPWELSPTGVRRRTTVDQTGQDLAILYNRLRLTGQIGLDWHNPDTYAFRLRTLLPYPFPVEKEIPSVPGLHELDQLNLRMNIILSVQTNRNVVWSIPGNQFGPPPQLQDGSDPIGDFQDVGDAVEGAIYPFVCPGDEIE